MQQLQHSSSSSSSTDNRLPSWTEYPRPHPSAAAASHNDHHHDHHHQIYRDSVRYSSSTYTSTGTASVRSESPAIGAAAAHAHAQQQQQGGTPGTASRASTPKAHKKTSLAAIHAPSFSAFRSQVPSAAVRRPTVSDAAFLRQKSPRAASFSIAAQPSPRLADPHWRPYSLDSPLPNTHRNQGSEVAPLYAEQVDRPREEVDR